MRTVDEYIDELLTQPCESLKAALDHADEQSFDFASFMFDEIAKLNSLQYEWDKAPEKKKYECEQAYRAYCSEMFERMTELNNKITQAKEYSSKVAELQLHVTYNDIIQYINADITLQKGEVAKRYEDKIDKLTAQIQSIIKADMDKRHANNESYKNDISSYNDIYNTLIQKQKELSVYSDKILEIASEYGISAYDMEVDPEQFTNEQLVALYDKFIHELEADEVKGNIITWLRVKFPSPTVQGIILVIMFALSFTPVLDIFAIAFIIYLIKSSMGMNKNLKVYATAYSLVYNVDFMSKLKQLDSNQLVAEEISDAELDAMEEVTPLCKELGEVMDAYEEEIKCNDTVMLLNEISKRQGDISKRIQEVIEECEELRTNIVNNINSEIDILLDFQKRVMSDRQKFGRAFRLEPYWNPLFELGYGMDPVTQQASSLIKPVTYNQTLRNQIIRTQGMHGDKELKSFLRCLYVNALQSVKPDCLEVFICDPNGRNTIFAAFDDPNMATVLHSGETDIKKVLEDAQKFFDKNYKDAKGMSINDFNEDAYKKGSRTLTYRLIIIASQPKTLEENEALRSFMNLSTDGGVFVWVVSNELSVFDADDAHKPITWQAPWQGIKFPYSDQTGDDNWCRQFTKEFLTFTEYARKKNPGVNWDMLRNKIIPESQIWTFDSREQLDLFPGYEDGDPDRYPPQSIGNSTGNVHVLAAGGTGAGKSVFLNYIIAQLCMRYDPWNLELWLCDFKGVEFSFYMKGDGKPYMLPHIKACLCTTDGDFSSSLFRALSDMTEKRQKLFMTRACKNLVDWNNTMDSDARKAKEDGDEEAYKAAIAAKLPRVILVCDEFQVIFEKADDKQKMEITKAITQIAKVARAAGAHLFFTSQSLKKTVSDDVLQQFSMRFCLRCDKEVSQSLLYGNPAAGEIRAKNGWLYVTNSAWKNEPRLHSTPYIPETISPAKKKSEFDSLRDIINYLGRLAEERGWHRDKVITYEETEKHYIEEIDEGYKKFRENNPDVDISNIFLIGSPMVVSESSITNFLVDVKDNEHIFAVFKEYMDVWYFYATIMRNLIIKKKAEPQTQFFVNVMINDLVELLDPVQDYAEFEAEYENAPVHYKRYLTPKDTNVREMVGFIKRQLEGRKKLIDDGVIKAGNEYPPLYFILVGWNKADGFGVSPDTVAVADFATILNTCASLNIHVIFICSGLDKIRESIYGSCAHRITGHTDRDTSLSIIGSTHGGKTYDDMSDGYYFFIDDRGLVSRQKLFISKPRATLKAKSIVV